MPGPDEAAQGLAAAPRPPAPFVAAVHGPVITLLFASKPAQHAALARIEAFYESSSHANAYLTQEHAARERICLGYEAFNFPLDSVVRWLAAMRRAEPAAQAPPASSDPWWHTSCTLLERAFLHYLVDMGLLDAEGGATASAEGAYVIAALASSAQEALAHERLHVLYYRSPAYRALLAELWNELPQAARGAIELDLRMRRYRESVWQDELGAYLGIRPAPRGVSQRDPSLEFGNKNAATCREIRAILLQRIPQFWHSDVGIDEAELEVPPDVLAAAKQLPGGKPTGIAKLDAKGARTPRKGKGKR